MSSEAQPTLPGGEFILYQTEDRRTRLEVRFQGDSVWLSLNQMADLFQRDKSVISRHIKNAFDEGELMQGGTVAKSATVQMEGKKQVTRAIEFYNLDVIIAVGYRVKNHRGTQFRIWATQGLREYLVKGFTMDDERLKNPASKGQKDYFDELLERIRDIRATVLPEGARYLRDVCGLRSRCGTGPTIFCRSTKQDALGNPRPYLCRDHPRACRRGSAIPIPRRSTSCEGDRSPHAWG